MNPGYNNANHPSSLFFVLHLTNPKPFKFYIYCETEKSCVILQDIAGGNGVRDLKPRVDFKVVFRIHEPYTHIVGDNNRPGRCIQEIAVVGRHPLTYLRDSIMCEADFQDVNGDISENPDTPITKRARVSPFGFFITHSLYLPYFTIVLRA